jgi:hypothetical protein
MKHKTRLAMVATLVWIGWACSAAAQPYRHMAGTGPCQADIEKLCANIETGRGRLRQCLKEHENDLSPECRQFMQSMHRGPSRGRSWHEACRADVEKFCKDAPPGRGGIYKCLQAHASELSESCKSVMAGPPAKGGTGSAPAADAPVP